MTLIPCAPDVKGRGVPSLFHSSACLPKGRPKLLPHDQNQYIPFFFPKPSKFCNLLTFCVDLIQYMPMEEQNHSLLSSCRYSYLPQRLMKVVAYHLPVKLRSAKPEKVVFLVLYLVFSQISLHLF